MVPRTRFPWLGSTLTLAFITLAATGPSEESTVPKPDATLAKIDAFIAEKAIDTSATGWKTRLPAPPEVSFESGQNYYWLLETNKGNLKIRLFSDVAPKHVASTIYLTRLGFYDELRFHRVIPEFMAQGGDPIGNGTGSPGYEYAGEFDPKVKHDRAGRLSAANRGPGTDGSQFFLTFAATPWLDGKHTIFGEVVEGMATLKELEKAGTRSGSTTEELRLEKAAIQVE